MASYNEQDLWAFMRLIDKLSDSTHSRIMNTPPELIEPRRASHLTPLPRTGTGIPYDNDLSYTIRGIAKYDNAAAFRDMLLAGTFTPNMIFEGHTLLRLLCVWDAHSCAALLLQSPELDVNAGDYPPFGLDVVETTRLLLRDPRLRPNKRCREGFTPLYWAVLNHRVEATKIWAASGRPFHIHDKDLKHVAGRLGVVSVKTHGDTTFRAYHEMSTFLNDMRTNPHITRYNLRLKLGELQYHAAFTFAVVVFLCDGLFKLAQIVPDKMDAAYRFLAICQKLTMKLQMLLCLRSVGSMDTVIEVHQREEAFRFLGYQLKHRVNSDLE